MFVTWFLSTITNALFTYRRISPLNIVPTLYDDHKITLCHAMLQLQQSTGKGAIEYVDKVY